MHSIQQKVDAKALLAAIVALALFGFLNRVITLFDSPDIRLTLF